MKPILIHLHLFYTAQWPELRECLKNAAAYPYELYVTLIGPHAELEADIAGHFPAAHVLYVENRGYDIAPFLHVLSQVELEDYSYVIKLHTKRGEDALGVNLLKGEEWRRTLLAFLSTPQRFRQHMEAFEQNPRIGMQADYQLLVTRDYRDKELERLMRDWMRGHGLPRVRFSYVAGSMFIVRAELLRPLRGLGLSPQDFPAVSDHRAQLAHVLERLFGYFVYRQGCIISDRTEYGLSARYQRKLRIHFALEAVRRFVFQTKRTSSGRRIVKILKVPVYASREEKHSYNP